MLANAVTVDKGGFGGDCAAIPPLDNASVKVLQKGFIDYILEINADNTISQVEVAILDLRGVNDGSTSLEVRY